MLKNYLKIALRNLIKNKVFSFINVIGLSIGIVACLVILSYVNTELKYDGFHSKSDRIYRIAASEDRTYQQGSSLSPTLLGVELKRKYAEVLHATKMILPWSGQAATSTLGFPEGGTSLAKQSFNWGFFVSPDFFEMFDFPMIQGNAQMALDGTNRVVLSESAAEKLFGNDWREKDVLGENLEYVNEFDRFLLEVTGIVSDPPADSHFDYDFLASFSTLNTGWGKDYVETWDGHDVYNYLELAEGSNPEVVEEYIQTVIASEAPVELRENGEFLLQPMMDIHLKSNLDNELKVNGKISRVYFLSLLAFLILVIAVGNYINLTISSSIPRGSEVGVRKVMGALRSQLISQFLIESLLIVYAALVVAILVLFLGRAFYDELIGMSFYLNDPILWIAMLVFVPVLILLSGLYPAFILSGYSPVSVLKGKLKHSNSGKNLRSGLIIFQFSASIVLVAFTLVLFKQVFFMQNNDPGFSKNGVLVINGPANRNETWIEHDQKQKSNADFEDAFKNKLSQFSSVSASSLSWSIPGEAAHLSGLNLGDNYQNSSLDLLIADDDFFKVYDIQVLAGNFTVENGIVINQSALELLGFESPQQAIGESFIDNREIRHRINGVIKDYHHFGFRQKIHPLAFAKNDPSYKLDSFYSLKVNKGNLSGTLEEIEKAYAEVFPGDSFDYFFMDSHFEQQYLSEKSFGKVFGIFSVLAIFIACLGLFGLSLQSALERTKEIGIRKVLGAKELEIMGLLLKSTVKILGISVLIAIPVSYIFSINWLGNFAYRIDLTWWMFLVGPFAILLIALSTVGFQSLKVAFQNPVKALTSE